MHGRTAGASDRPAGQKYYRCRVPGRQQQNLDRDSSLVQKLAQRRYLEKSLAAAQAERDALQAYHHIFHGTTYEDVYCNLTRDRQALVTPLFLTEEEEQRKWEAAPHRKKEIRDSWFECPDGLHVRSKSEVMIVRCLQDFHVPFRYECGIQLSSGRWIYPDFTVLNVRLHRVYLYEHFGMLGGEPKYFEAMQKKLLDYQVNGFVPGKNFAYTVESKNRPLQPEVIQEIIQSNFL